MVDYISQEEMDMDPECKEWGISAPGWYFFGEDGATAHGPFDSHLIALEELNKYCETITKQTQ